MKQYAYWRTDKPKEPGYTHELISLDFDDFRDKTNVDELNILPFPGVDTLTKAFDSNLLKRIPQH